jgi:hypothetical protein
MVIVDPVVARARHRDRVTASVRRCTDGTSGSMSLLTVPQQSRNKKKPT